LKQLDKRQKKGPHQNRTGQDLIVIVGVLLLLLLLLAKHYFSVEVAVTKAWCLLDLRG